MDDLLKNIYSDSLSLEPFPSAANAASPDANACVSTQGSFSMPKKTVDQVLKEIVTGGIDHAGGAGGAAGEGMTLEDFLSKAGVREDEIGGQAMSVVGGYSGVSSIINGDDSGGGTLFQSPSIDGSIIGFGNGIDGSILASRGNGGGGRGGRGKRRAVEEPVDKVTQQKQRRMIKNRESAARSRERKQAYAVELELLVIQLEEENAKLRREKADDAKKRFKQLMEKLIPVVEKKKQSRTLLRRIHSMEW